jgi:hypothetical protein
MKMILFASALALSTAAMAQDATPAQTTPPADSSTMPAATPDASAPASAPMTPDANTAPAPDASAPPATTPAAGDTGMASGASSTDDSNLPMCSKTVTDKCKQGGKSGGHHMTHHKK